MDVPTMIFTFVYCTADIYLSTEITAVRYTNLNSVEH